MARFGLMLYLTLATAAGPWFCCCTGVKLLALFAEMGRMVGAEQKKLSCCCGDHKGNCSHPPSESAPPSQPCTCPATNPQPATTEDSDDASFVQPSRFHSPSESAGNSAPLPLDIDLAEGALLRACKEPLASPFADGRDILCALHILRC
jgi:hypothetical protein